MSELLTTSHKDCIRHPIIDFTSLSWDGNLSACWVLAKTSRGASVRKLCFRFVSERYHLLCPIPQFYWNEKRCTILRPQHK